MVQDVKLSILVRERERVSQQRRKIIVRNKESVCTNTQVKWLLVIEMFVCQWNYRLNCVLHFDCCFKCLDFSFDIIFGKSYVCDYSCLTGATHCSPHRAIQPWEQFIMKTKFLKACDFGQKAHVCSVTMLANRKRSANFLKSCSIEIEIVVVAWRRFEHFQRLFCDFSKL